MVDINVFLKKKREEKNCRGSRATASYARMRNEAKWSAMKKKRQGKVDANILSMRRGGGGMAGVGGTSSQMRLYLHFERGGVFVLDRRQTQIMPCDLKCN